MASTRGEGPVQSRFEQIAVGDVAELTHLITDADVDTFARLTGDENPLHLDRAFARRTSFRKPVVHGMLSASFISTIIGMRLPGPGALWTRQSLEFLGPAFIGDTIRVRARVKQVSVATRTIVLDIDITNQHEQRLVAGEGVVKMPELTEERSPAADTATSVVVTGGSRGIGAATVRRLASDGHAVTFSYVRSAADAEGLAADVTARGGRALAVRADVADDAEVHRLFATACETFGPVRGLVHGAALGSLVRPFAELTWNDFQRQLDVQVRGAVQCVQAALPAMLAAEGGSVVFIGSTAADGVPPSQQADYVVAKAALTSLARSLAVEYGPKGVRFNVVAPGMTNTDMIASLPDKARMLTRMRTPLRQLADPGDVAEAVSFLLSARARHITGETTRVCGGAVMA
jgi:3-oxoacyl-[acyl-carrier protein] reductase